MFLFFILFKHPKGNLELSSNSDPSSQINKDFDPTSKSSFNREKIILDLLSIHVKTTNLIIYELNNRNFHK